MILALAILTGCSNSSLKQHKPTAAPVSPPVNATRIGGWAPVFFTNLNQEQLAIIAHGINNQQISHAVISYPTKMQNLAKQIRDYLQQTTHQIIPMRSVELKNTTQVTYALTQVVVILYFK
jgi:hypothetical protein